MSDLLVTSHTPVLRSGRAMRTYTIARALAGEDGLDLLYVRFEGDEPDAAFSSIPGIRMHAVVSSRGAERLRAYLDARLEGLPHTLARALSPELAAAAASLAEEPGRGRVIADGPVVARTLARLSRRRPVIYNAHNLESGFRHELGAGSGSARANRRLERGLLSRASESWMVSERDLAGARELLASARLRLVPNVVDVASIEPLAPAGTSEPRAIFVANFSYLPNRSGLEFLLGEVFPRVWRELPDARVRLVGAGLERPPSEDPRVETLGFLDDLRAAYASAACAVVPLLVGGGTPLKFIEALAYGLPVLATPRAAAGLEVLDGEHCLIADGADAFADALVRVLRDGAPTIARRGRELAERRYSIEALRAALAD